MYVLAPGERGPTPALGPSHFATWVHFGCCLLAHPQDPTAGSGHRGIDLVLKSRHRSPVFPGLGAQGEAPLHQESSPEGNRKATCPTLGLARRAGEKKGVPHALPCKQKENRKREAKTWTCNRSWAFQDWRGSPGDGRARSGEHPVLPNTGAVG